MAARQRFPLNYAIAMPSSAEALLVHQLECSRLLHQERGASAALAAALDRVAQWQARRLNATYSDLAADPRYAGAIAFFQSELYGPGDFSQRDADLARVVPIMIRVLPDAVAIQLTYWLVTRAETLRRPEVAAVVDAIRDRVHEQRDVLLGLR